MRQIPKNVQRLLKRLNKSEKEIAEYCIDHATEILKENGYEDSRMWATTILSSLLPDLDFMESEEDLQIWLLELDELEQDVAEAILNTFSYLKKSLRRAKHTDILDTLKYSISKVLNELEKEKYYKSYG